MKSSGCVGCHQLGQASTRTVPAAFGSFPSGALAWMRRVQAGQSGEMRLAAAVRGPGNPAFCRKGSDHPSARACPLERSMRHLAVLDPRTLKYTFVDTCFGTHHLQCGYDANDTLWTSGGGPVVGWLNSKLFDETGDAARSQGWTALVLDTNGNGTRDDYVEPDRPLDPTKDKRVDAGFYAVMPNPTDGSVWGSFRGRVSGVVRLAPGAWAASTAPSARARSRGRRPPAITVPKAGRSTSSPGPGSRASARTVRSRAITRGSISTIHSASGATCRSRPAT